MDEQLNTQIIKTDKALNAALLKQSLQCTSNPAGKCQCQYHRKKPDHRARQPRNK
jgi:hypothetical protein